MGSKKWTETTINFLKANAMLMTDRQLATALSTVTGRVYTRQDIQIARNKLTNVRSAVGTGKHSFVMTHEIAPKNSENDGKVPGDQA